MNLKVVQIQAYTLKEAIEKAEELTELKVKYNVTRSYNDKIIFADFDLDEFATEKLNKVVKDAIGVGFVIAKKPGVPETKSRLYDVENIVAGVTKYKLFYQVVDTDGQTYGKDEVKAEAIKIAKGLMNTLKRELHVIKVKFPVEGEEIAAIVRYNPSDKVELGKYIIFGYEN